VCRTSGASDSFLSSYFPALARWAKVFVVPPGLLSLGDLYPVLTHWANLCRASGAREAATRTAVAGSDEI